MPSTSAIGLSGASFHSGSENSPVPGFADRSPTVAQLTGILGGRGQTDAWSPIVPAEAHGRELPFFWIHGDSSTACLRDYLGEDRPLYAIKHQAHDDRAARFTEVETIAAHYLAQVRAIRPHGPYVLGGYSFGAVVAFEMAQQLQRAHEDVSLLFMLDPPSMAKASRSTAVANPPTHFLPRLNTAIRSRISACATGLTTVVNRARWSVCLMTARPLSASLRSAYLLDVYKRACSSYAPRQYSGRVVIVKAQHVSYPPPRHWPSLVSGPLEMHGERGRHMEMTREPLVARWAPTLKRALDESSALRPLRAR